MWKVKEKTTGDIRAAKIIKKSKMSSDLQSVEMLKSECSLLRQLVREIRRYEIGFAARYEVIRAVR